MTVTCGVCRQLFVAHRATARFCGARCRKAAQRSRGREWVTNVTLTRSPAVPAVNPHAPKSLTQFPAWTLPQEQSEPSSVADVTLSERHAKSNALPPARCCDA